MNYGPASSNIRRADLGPHSQPVRTRKPRNNGVARRRRRFLVSFNRRMASYRTGVLSKSQVLSAAYEAKRLELETEQAESLAALEAFGVAGRTHEKYEEMAKKHDKLAGSRIPNRAERRGNAANGMSSGRAAR